jgi:LDH2 family malate/lactate/ureidoglycolate dehydrogenase
MTSARVGVEDLQGLAEALLVANGADPEEAAVIARVMVWCECVDRRTYGMWRLPIVCAKIAAGAIASPCTPYVERLAPALARIDARGGAGQFVASIAARQAAELARESGIAAALVRGGHHFGAASYYAHLIAEQDLVGLVATNAAPKVAPWGGVRPVLGTNALAFAAPRADGRSVLVDLATSAAAAATLRWAAERGAALPEGVAVDERGEPLHDYARLKEGALLPFGGAKGYALGLVVEILAGVLGGGGMSNQVVTSFGESSNASQIFVAVDITRFMSKVEFDERLEHLVDSIHASGLEGAVVRVPGEQRWEAFARASSGIMLDPETVGALEQLAAAGDVSVPWS